MRGLYRNSLFKGIPLETIDSLIGNVKPTQYSTGNYILRQEDPPNGIYLLNEGKVEVQAISAAGRPYTLLFHSAPSIFGELELFSSLPNLANVIAVEPCEVTHIKQKHYLKILHSNHQIAINMTQHLTKLTVKIEWERRLHLFGKVEHWLGNLLCSYAQMYGEERNYGVFIQKEINRTEMADVLGVSRQSVIKALTELSRLKLVELTGKQLVIPDLKKLKAKVHSVVQSSSFPI